MASPYSSNSATSSLNPSNLASFSPSLTEESYNKVQKIIDMERYNGRVNIMDLPDKDTRFKMYEKIAVKNKATEFRESLVGVQEDNMLGKVFFSQGNVQILQNGLRAGVYEMSNQKIVIPPQNVDQLKIIMRSTYLQYSEHNDDSITKQVERLNKIVLDWAVPTVYNEAMGYMRYIQDQSTLVRPLEMPKLVDKDFKQLEWKRWF
jgi:hypothetical protein